MLSQKRTWIGLVIVAFFFYFIFRNIDLQKLTEAFSHFNSFWLLPALAIYSLGYIIRSYRWGILLAPIKKCSFKTLYPTLLIGFSVNNILPFRLGDFYRAHLIGKKENISRSAALATIIVEKLFDGIAMLLILGISVFMRHPASTSVSQTVESSAKIASYIFGAGFLVCFSMLLFKKQTIKIINYVISHAPKKYHTPLERVAHTFLDGLKILQDAKESFTVLITSLASWSCEFMAFFFIAVGFQLAPEPLHINSSALIMVITNLGLMVPSTPGGLGVFEWVGVNLLGIYSISKESALAYILIVHVLVWLPITLMGLYCLFHEGLTLKSIEKEKQNS